jgi:hypothetical protein
MDYRFAAEYVDAATSLRWPDREDAFRQLAAGRRPSAHWSVALDVAVGLEDDGEGSLRVAVSEGVAEACWLDQVTRPLSESNWHGPTLVVEAGLENGAFLTRATVTSLRKQLGDQMNHEIVDLPHTITADGPDILAALVRGFVNGGT